MLSRQHYAILCQYDEVSYFHTCQMSVLAHMNKFVEVSTDGHQITLAGSRIAGRVGPCGGSHADVGGGGGCTVMLNVSWVMVTC